VGAADIGQGRQPASYSLVDNTTARTVLYNLLKPDIRVDDDALARGTRWL
jgi:hypothetical protein